MMAFPKTGKDHGISVKAVHDTNRLVVSLPTGTLASAQCFLFIDFGE
jgi:hypothetical protein